MNSLNRGFPALLARGSIFLASDTYGQKSNPDACDCNTIIVSDEETGNGCPAFVKEQIYPLYRQAMWQKDYLNKEQDLRKLEKRMEPRFNKP